MRWNRTVPEYTLVWANGIGARVTELTKDDLKVARLNRQRLAAEDGARAMEEAAKKDADVRVNMARLRELRLAKEAQEARSSISTSDQPATAKLKKPVR
jgi:hypothetical protein